MPRGVAEVADVFRRYGDAYRQQHGCSLSTAQRRVMTAIEQCRTAALGGHVEQCDTCGHQRICYNSCRNRHCPKCQSLARAQWLDDRRSELLAVPYFHVVFTVPPPSPITTRDRFTTSCSTPPPKLCARSPPIPSISAQSSASSPSSTLGGRRCSIIHTCIASSPVAVSLATATDGSPAGPPSFYPSTCWPVCSAGCSCNTWNGHSMPAN